MTKRNLSPGQWLFITGMGISVVCAWAWLISSALARALNGDHGSWVFVVLFSALAVSALATIALAPRHLALLNMDGVLLKQQRALLLAQRQTTDKP